MPKKLFEKSDREVANHLISLIYTNPFSAKRREIDEQLLADASAKLADFQPAKVQNQMTQNVILQGLLHITGKLLEQGKKKLSKVDNPDIFKDLETYEHLVYFYIFHQRLDEIDDYIRKCLESPSNNPKWAESAKLEADFKYYLWLSDQPLATTYTIEEFISFCFQIRRAFYHTRQTIVGESLAINRLRERIWDSIFTHNMPRYLRSLYSKMSDVYTLITGPSGSGKENVARCIGLSRFIPFDCSTRMFERNFLDSFYAINLSALSETIIESELFGHKKGAFTGALQDKLGYFESSGAYGTVFLDEIGDTDTSIQVKLLRLLQTRQFQRLGDTHTLSFEGKVMAATNVDLAKAIQQGHFREDFYYRLCADQISTPSLRDILNQDLKELSGLVDHICLKFVGEQESDELSKECMQWIESNLSKSYQWPGNFRELEQCVRNIMVQGKYTPPSKQQHEKSANDAFKNGSKPLDDIISLYIQQEYNKTPSLVDVAQRLEIDPRTVKKYLR